MWNTQYFPCNPALQVSFKEFLRDSFNDFLQELSMEIPPGVFQWFLSRFLTAFFEGSLPSLDQKFLKDSSWVHEFPSGIRPRISTLTSTRFSLKIPPKIYSEVVSRILPRICLGVDSGIPPIISSLISLGVIPVILSWFFHVLYSRFH